MKWFGRRAGRQDAALYGRRDAHRYTGRHGAAFDLPVGRFTRNVACMSGAPYSPDDSIPPNPLLSGFHFRGRLPHLKKEGATYFVTFRLGDSLPAQEVARLKRERLVILEQARAAKRPLTWHEEEQLLAWYCDKVEALLDAGHGACWLSKPEVAKLVANAVRFFQGERYELRAWVVMPNHVHVVVWPTEGHTLSEILHSWKSYTSKEANKLVYREGQGFWQKESFNHWIRNDDERARLAAYVEHNPIKAGLCRRPEDWRWSSAANRTVAAGVSPASRLP